MGKLTGIIQQGRKGVLGKTLGCMAAAGLAASLGAGAAFATDYVQTAYDLPAANEVKSFQHTATDNGAQYTYEYVSVGSNATGRVAPMMETYYETVGLNYANAYCGPGTIFNEGSDATAWYERSDSNLNTAYTEGAIGSLKTHNSTLAIQLNNQNPDEFVWNYLCWANGAEVTQDRMAVDHGNNGKNNEAGSALQPVSVTIGGTEYADFPRDVYTECNMLSGSGSSDTYGDNTYAQWIALENLRSGRPKSGTYDPYFAKYSAVSGGGATMVAGLQTLASTIDGIVAQSVDANGNYTLQSRFGGNSANGTVAAVSEYEDLVQATQYYVLSKIADKTVDKAVTAVLVGYDPATGNYACRKYLVAKEDARGNKDKDVNLYGGRLAGYLGDYTTSITDLGLTEAQEPTSSTEADYIAWYTPEQIVENCDAAFVCDAPSSNKVSDYLATASDGQCYVVYSPATARSDGEEDRTAGLTQARDTAQAAGKDVANFCFSYPATMFGNFYAQGVENGMIPLVTASFTYPEIFGDNGLTDLFAYWAKYVWHIKNANLQSVVTATAGDMATSGGLSIGTISTQFEKNAKDIFNAGNRYYLDNKATVDAINDGNMATYDADALAARTPAAQTISVTKSSVSVKMGAAAVDLGAKASAGGELTYRSSDTSIATVSAAGEVTPKGVGSAKIIISAASTDSNVSAGTVVTVKVTKGTNPMTVKAKTVAAKAKKKTTIKATKAFTVKKAAGKVTYAKKSGNAKITISKAGKITVKKGLKKGKTYNLKVKVTAAGNDSYKKLTKTVTVKVKVK